MTSLIVLWVGADEDRVGEGGRNAGVCMGLFPLLEGPCLTSLVVMRRLRNEVSLAARRWCMNVDRRALEREREREGEGWREGEREESLIIIIQNSRAEY